MIIYCSFKSSQATSQGTRTATTSRSGNQCCYDFGGNLIPPGKLGAGTVDLVSPEVSVWGHFWADVLPAIACCWTVFADCSSYRKQRPVGDCSGYQPPPPGNISRVNHSLVNECPWEEYLTCSPKREWVLLYKFIYERVPTC